MSKISEAVSKIAPDFNMAPFAMILTPLLDEVLDEQGLNKFRQGTILIPRLLMWLILMLTIRRDLAYNKVLSWMISGFRWIRKILPAKNQIVKDGTISKARIRLGVEPLRALFYKLTGSFASLPKDFHKWISLSVDGTTATMPDTDENVETFKKPSSRRGSSGFPQVRIMSLLINSLHLIFDIEYAPYSGKKTGERTLLMKLLERFKATADNCFLFLLDAGLYSGAMLWEIKQKGQDFIIKVPSQVKFKAIKYLPDGSYIAILTHKVLDLDAVL